MTACKYKTEDLLNELFDIVKNDFNGDTPSRKKINEKLTASASTYENRFGSWNNALKEAGLEVNRLADIPKENFIEEIQRVSEEYFDGKAPSCFSMEKYSKYSNKSYQDNFGSWNNALCEAGFEVNQEPNYDKEDLLSDLRRVSKEYCDEETPQAEDVDLHGKWTTPVYYSVFESFNNALKEAGFSLNQRSPGQGIRIDYGNSYNEELKDTIYSRDDYICAVCLSENTYGYNPDIHHITPHYFWRDNEHEQMNNPRNLICLCRSCHRKLEGKFKGRNYEGFKRLAKEELNMRDKKPEEKSVFNY